MKTIINPEKATWSNILQRPTQTVNDIETTVTQIFEDVQRNGDQAIAKYTQLFDGVELASNTVTIEEVEAASAKISIELKQAIQQAKTNNINKK